MPAQVFSVSIKLNDAILDLLFGNMREIYFTYPFASLIYYLHSDCIYFRETTHENKINPCNVTLLTQAGIAHI